MRQKLQKKPTGKLKILRLRTLKVGLQLRLKAKMVKRMLLQLKMPLL
jgi:hypothetical protein